MEEIQVAVQEGQPPPTPVGLSLEKAEALQYANGYYPDLPRRRMFCYLVLRQFEMEDEEEERGLWERFWT